MLPLRYPKLWWALGWLLLAGVVIGSLVPGEMLRSLDSDDKLLHASSYFLLMVWFAGLYRRSYHPLVAAVLLALGIALDMLQGLTATRTFDLRDIGADFFGILAGLAVSVLLLEGWCQRLERRLFAAGA